MIIQSTARKILSVILRLLGLGPRYSSAPRLPNCGKLLNDTPVSRRALVMFFGVMALAYGLLWSRWWYPLSDSSLYLSLARNLCEGRGYTFLGQPHRDVPPLYPLFLAGLMQISRTFALLNLSSVVLSWLSLVLMYTALRRWLPWRITLVAVVLSGSSYWYFQNATVLLSEPPFLCLLWLAVIGLSRCCSRDRIRLGWLIVGVLAYLLLFATRIAGCLLAPGLLLALWYGTKHQINLRRRILVCLVFSAVAGGGAWGYFLWRDYKPEATVVKTPVVQETDPEPVKTNPASIYRFLLEPKKSRSERMLLKSPAKFVKIAGRWLAEGFVGASYAGFATKSRPLNISTYTVAIFALSMVLLGVFRLAISGCHWLIWPMIYILPILMRWQFRLKPRYVNPILPLLAVAGLVGLWTLGQLIGRLMGDGSASPIARRLAVPAVVVLILAGNLPSYAGEIYVRWFARTQYYNVARQGAYASMVDAAAHIRKNEPPGGTLYFTYICPVRVIHVMTGKDVAYIRATLRSADDQAGIEDLGKRVPANTLVLAHFFDRNWPVWHFGTNRITGPYWGLYRHVQGQGLERIHTPPDRSFLLSVPPGEI